MKLAVAITGASGTIYGYRLCKALVESSQVEQLHIIISEYGEQVASHEGFLEQLQSLPSITLHKNSTMFNTLASGSSRLDGLVVMPGSAATMASIANGTANTLITRCADVMLKERRKLIYCLRETPLNSIHISNMGAITAAGGVIMPLSPSFYSKPATIEELVDTQVERVMSLLGINSSRYIFEG